MNHVVLIGRLVGKFDLPYAKIYAFEIDCEGTEFVIHTGRSIYDEIDLPDVEVIAVKGHLYHFDGRMYVYADKVSILGA